MANKQPAQKPAQKLNRKPATKVEKKPDSKRGGESLQDYEQRLREGGQFATVQRRAILRYLLRHDDHPTTSQIAASVGQSGAASLATVYNNLALFAKLQLVSGVRAPDGELHWDLRTDLHHHLVCQRCHRVVDIEAAAAQVILHDPQLQRSVERAEVWLIGQCRTCSELSPSSD